MIGRVLALAGGLAGAGATAQFPEFSQQYLQRLGGAVQALDQVLADFDASAADLGLNRYQALDQMRGTAFVDKRRADMEATFARHARLAGDLAALRDTGPFMRVYHAGRMGDRDLLQGTWGDFKPAVPLTFEGAVFAGSGFVLGGMLVAALLGAWRAVWRRMRAGGTAAA